MAISTVAGKAATGNVDYSGLLPLVWSDAVLGTGCFGVFWHRSRRAAALDRGADARPKLRVDFNGNPADYLWIFARLPSRRIGYPAGSGMLCRPVGAGSGTTGRPSRLVSLLVWICLCRDDERGRKRHLGFVCRHTFRLESLEMARPRATVRTGCAAFCRACSALAHIYVARFRCQLFFANILVFKS